MHRTGYPKGTFHLPLRYVLCRGPQELAAFPGWEWLGHWLISRLFYSHVLAGWFRDQKLATMIWHYDLSMWFGFLTPWWPQCDSTHVVAQGSKHKHYEKREKLTWHFMILLEMTDTIPSTVHYWLCTEVLQRLLKQTHPALIPGQGTQPPPCNQKSIKEFWDFVWKCPRSHWQTHVNTSCWPWKSSEHKYGP